MLKINPNPTFKSSVKIVAPGGEEHAVTFEFKHMTKAKLDEFVNHVSSDEGRAKTEEQNLMSIVCGWSGVDTNFSEEALGLLLQNYQSAPAAIMGTYIRELTALKLGN